MVTVRNGTVFVQDIIFRLAERGTERYGTERNGLALVSFHRIPRSATTWRNGTERRFIVFSFFGGTQNGTERYGTFEYFFR